MTQKNPDYIAVAENILSQQFADADCAFIAGSMLRGEATASSDIDLIVLYNDVTHESYRHSTTAEGWPVEIFVQNLKSQDYFLNSDIERGVSMTATMIATGILIGSDKELGNRRKEKARSILAQGPAIWSKDKIDAERYFITDLWDDVRAPKDPDAVAAILANLMPRLGDFYFRSQNKWSGSGKYLIRLLKQDNPELATDFIAAFSRAHQHDFDPLHDVINRILQPYGGMLFDGYTAVTTAWKTPE